MVIPPNDENVSKYFKEVSDLSQRIFPSAPVRLRSSDTDKVPVTATPVELVASFTEELCFS